MTTFTYKINSLYSDLNSQIIMLRIYFTRHHDEATEIFCALHQQEKKLPFATFSATGFTHYNEICLVSIRTIQRASRALFCFSAHVHLFLSQKYYLLMISLYPRSTNQQAHKMSGMVNKLVKHDYLTKI